MTNRLTKIVSKEIELLDLIDEISGLADLERAAVGFWPKSALLEAIQRGNLFALVCQRDSVTELIGYVHHSGAYPHAKVQQIAIKPAYRGQGYATALLNALVSKFEKLNYLTIRADVAEDLQGSLKFYRKNRFLPVISRRGGKSRGRKIILHERALETDDLFKFSQRKDSFDLGISRRASAGSRIYAFDLNVYFDLVRDREKSEQARRIFGAALAHEVRIAVAAEFVAELQKTSRDRVNDPIFQMALRLPQLPKVDEARRAKISAYVHDLVFVQTGNRAAGSVQALSDASHVAHAALARVSGFITRDDALLRCRERILESVGIDVFSSDELVDILPRQLAPESTHTTGEGFQIQGLDQQEIARFIKSEGVDCRFSEHIHTELWDSHKCYAEGVVIDGEIVALGAVVSSGNVPHVANLFLYARPYSSKAAFLVDFLIDRMLGAATAGKPVGLLLENIPGQSVVGAVARERGFFLSQNRQYYEKVALGHPLTFRNWSSTAEELRRCTGLRLPNQIDNWNEASEVTLTFPSGQMASLSLAALESFLSPTVIVPPYRFGAIVPISGEFSDELLGAGDQKMFPFVEKRDVSFARRRSYVGTPRSASVLRPDTPVLFYESLGRGKGANGRGAVVAFARVSDSLIVRKQDVDNETRRSLVVQDLSKFSSTESVLVTSFEGVVRNPIPVTLSKLRKIGAVDGSNLVSSRALDAEKISRIVEIGWGFSA